MLAVFIHEKQNTFGLVQQLVHREQNQNERISDCYTSE